MIAGRKDPRGLRSGQVLVDNKVVTSDLRLMSAYVVQVRMQNFTVSSTSSPEDKGIFWSVVWHMYVLMLGRLLWNRIIFVSCLRVFCLAPNQTHSFSWFNSQHFL